MNLRKLLLLLFVAAVPSCSAATKPSTSEIKTGGNAVGGFKGYTEVNAAIANRLLDPSVIGAPNFKLSASMGDNSPESSGTAVLLGGFSGAASSNAFRNGTPNGVNMVVWHLLMTSLAENLARNCSGIAFAGTLQVGLVDFKLSSSFASRLKRACAWPAPDAAGNDAMLGLWLAIMGFDAPFEEYEAWKIFFTAPASAFKTMPADKAVAAMLRAIFLNPYFLLEH